MRAGWVDDTFGCFFLHTGGIHEVYFWPAGVHTLRTFSTDSVALRSKTLFFILYLILPYPI